MRGAGVMLGHSGPQSDPENALRIAVSISSDSFLVAEALPIYCTRYPAMSRLYQVFRGKDLLRFLTLYGGVTIHVPHGDNNLDEIKLSHLPDIAEHFGAELLNKFVDEFLGENVKVPPTDYITSSVRDVDIYRSLQDKKPTEMKQAARKLASYYRIRTVEVQIAFRRVKDALLDRTATGLGDHAK